MHPVGVAIDSTGKYAEQLVRSSWGYRKLPSPTGISATDGLYTDKVKIGWDRVPGASCYRVYRSTDPGLVTTSLLSTWQQATSYIDYPGIPGQTYYYAVQAAADCYGQRSSALSSIESGWQALQVPYTPTVSDATYTDKVSIIWASHSSYYYRVYRHSESNPNGAIALGNWQKGGYYEDVSAIPGQTYYYWLRAAVDASGFRASGFSFPDSGSRRDPTQPYYQLMVTLYGNGSHVVSNPLGLNCYGSICFLDYIEGTQTTLTAIPKVNSSFITWGGACSGTQECTVTMDANKAVRAYFSGPEINIKKDNTSYYNGATDVFIGTASIGSSIQVSFSIENTGNEELLIEGDASNLVAIQGANANEYSIAQQPNAVISAGGSTSFIIQFAPTATGNRTATISLANNDNDENPYTLTIIGEGEEQNSYLLWTK